VTENSALDLLLLYLAVSSRILSNRYVRLGLVVSESRVRIATFRKIAAFSTRSFDPLRFCGGDFRADITSTALSYDSSCGFSLGLAVVHGLAGFGGPTPKNPVGVAPCDLD